MKMKKATLNDIRRQIKRVQAADGFYAKRLKGIDPEDIKTKEDFEKLPFSEKDDLRDAYPLGLAAVPDEEIVRIHSSSGTTSSCLPTRCIPNSTTWRMKIPPCLASRRFQNTAIA